MLSWLDPVEDVPWEDFGANPNIRMKIIFLLLCLRRGTKCHERNANAFQTLTCELDFEFFSEENILPLTDIWARQRFGL